jgi:hypothetical protein
VRGECFPATPQALERVIALGRAARQGRVNPLTDPTTLALSDDVPDQVLRGAVLEQLNRLGRRLRTEAGHDDDGFDARYRAARSAARGARGLDIQEVINVFVEALNIDGFETLPMRPPPSLRARTASVQLLAGDSEELVAEDLNEVLAGYGIPAEELDGQRLRDELSGQSWWDGSTVGLTALRDAVRSASGERLVRAVTAATLGPALQWAILLQLPLDGRSHLLLRELLEHPAWSVWGRALLPPRAGRAGRLTTAFRAAALCIAPEWFLSGVERYVTCLCEAVVSIFGEADSAEERSG